MAQNTLENPSRVSAAFDKLAGTARQLIEFPIDASQRIHVLYLLTALLFAGLVYLGQRSRGGPAGPASWRDFVGFVFPREVWRSASAWLDVRYFFVHTFIRLLFYAPLVAISTGIVYYFGVMLLTGTAPGGPLPSGSSNFAVDIGFALVSTLLIDLVSYLLHRAQHKVPLLWEFHKVHHSATVMHPLSNYREHPVDNIAYAVGMGVAAGVIGSLCARWLGYMPSGPTVMGIGVFGFLFNALAYNLRHSHIWLRWRPEFMNKVFGCPAHHQVHHSCHPDHIDKNFAFLFPVWDVLFGTFCLPKTNEHVRFGLGTDEEREYDTCWRLYSLPFKKAFSRLRAAPSGPLSPLQ